MNRDIHILAESYKTIREQQFAKFGVSQQQGVTPSLGKLNTAMQGNVGGIDNMKADKLIDELIQDMGINPKYKSELIKLAISLAQKSKTQ